MRLSSRTKPDGKRTSVDAQVQELGPNDAIPTNENYVLVTEETQIGRRPQYVMTCNIVGKKPIGIPSSLPTDNVYDSFARAKHFAAQNGLRCIYFRRAAE